MKETVYVWFYFYATEYNEKGWSIGNVTRPKSYEEIGQDDVWNLPEGRMFLAERKVTVDLPSFDEVRLQEKCLEEQLQKLTAEYVAGKTALEAKLSELKALTYQ